jgi:hypothetical protein
LPVGRTKKIIIRKDNDICFRDLRNNSIALGRRSDRAAGEQPDVKRGSPNVS